MTINVSRLVSPDLFTDNPSLVFDRRQIEHDLSSIPPLGAVTFIAEKVDPAQKLSELAIACGKEAFSLIGVACDQPVKSWLFVSDGAWRDATRIALHQRLWKNHQDLVESCAGGFKTEEIEVRRDGKVRYAGLLEITDDLLEKAIDSCRLCSSFAIIVSHRSDLVLPSGIKQIFSRAFTKHNGVERTNIDWLPLAIAICPQGDLLLRVSGLFDDHEAAVDIIGTPQNLPEFGK